MRRMSVASFYWDFYIVWFVLVFVFVFMVEVTSAVATAVRNRKSYNLPTPIEHYNFTACSTILRVVPKNWMQPNDIAQSGRRPIFTIGPTGAGTTISTTTPPPSPQLPCDGNFHLRLVQLYSHFLFCL
jgi:hypothetical protein